MGEGSYPSIPHPPASTGLNSPDPSTRRLAVEELAEQGREEDIPRVMQCLKDDHPGVQQAAVMGLIHMGGATVVEHLVGMLRESPAIRNMAIEVIEHLVPAALDVTRVAMGSPDPQIRRFMVDAYGKQHDVRVIAPLIECLSDSDPNVRVAATGALGHLRATEAVPHILGLLQDDEWVIFSALSALSEIGDSSVLPSLLERIHHSSEAIRYAALEAIAQLDAEGRSVGPLLALVDTVEDSLRPALIKALVSIGKRTGADVWSSLDHSAWFQVLIEALEDTDPTVRLAAIVGLGQLNDTHGTRPILSIYRRSTEWEEEDLESVVHALVATGHIQELIQAASSDDERVAQVAIRALTALGAAEALYPLDAIRQTNPNWALRKDVLQALFAIGTDQALDCLTDAIDDPTGYVRCEAIRLLGTSPRPADLTRLLTKLQTERYEEVRQEIVHNLARAATKETWREIIALLATSHSEVKTALAQMIGLGKVHDGLKSVLHALNDPAWQVRQAAVEALGHFHMEEVVDPVMLALSDEHEQVRLSATVAVGQWESPEATKALLTHCLHDHDIWVRYRAVERLGTRRATEAVQALTTLATGPRQPTLLRRAAITALGTIGGDQATGTLRALHLQENPDLCEAATQALEGLAVVR